MKQIDEIDSNLLRSLLIESRISFTELAKICGISVTAVIRRYKRLKRAGIINGEHMHLNPVSMGYETVAEIGIITNTADTKSTLNILKKQQSLNIVHAPVSLGRYTIYSLLMARNLNEFGHLVRRIDIKPMVKSLDVLIIADLWDNPWHPENIVVNVSDRESFVAYPRKSRSKFEPVSLDQTDKRIVEMLMENSRLPFKDMAEKLEISTSTAIQKYHFLREKNVLNLSTLSLDISKLGYKAILDMYMKVENRGTLPRLEAQLLQIPNSTFCAKFVGGAYDLRIAFIITGVDDVFRIKQQISSLGNMRLVELYLHEVPSHWPWDFVGETWRQLQNL